jgi:hypothetical protein
MFVLDYDTLYEFGFDRTNNVRLELPPSARKEFSGVGNLFVRRKNTEGGAEH